MIVYPIAKLCGFFSKLVSKTILADKSWDEQRRSNTREQHTVKYSIQMEYLLLHVYTPDGL